MDVHGAIAESLDELRQWMPWAHGAQSVESAEEYVRQAHADFVARRNLALHVYLRDGGTFVGGSGLHDIEWSVPRFEIGYWVRSSLTGRGLATEATRRIADFAFDDLGAERVEIWCDAHNQRSAAVAQRAGFTFEARLERNRRDTAGELADSLCFVRLRHP
jgi:RimJ/RimL family protein N-acetyltransferase